MTPRTIGEALALLNSEFKRRLASQGEWDRDSVLAIWTEELLKAMRATAESEAVDASWIGRVREAVAGLPTEQASVIYGAIYELQIQRNEANFLRERERDELKRLRAVVGDYEEVLDSHRENVRLIDVAMNGEAGAAKQASLCDLIEQARRMAYEREQFERRLIAIVATCAPVPRGSLSGPRVAERCMRIARCICQRDKAGMVLMSSPECGEHR